MRRFVALPILALLAIPVAADGKPSSKVPPSETKSPPPSPSSSVMKVKTISKKHVDAIKSAKALGVKAKVQVLAESGIKVVPDDLGEPTTVSVRELRHDGVHVALVGMNMVLPQYEGGTAVIGQLNDFNDYDDATAPPSESGEIDLSAYVLPPCFPFLQCPGSPPSGGSSTPPPPPTRSSSYATLRFRAGADKGYLVDCLASAPADLHAQVIVGRTIVARESSTTAGGHFDVWISPGARRNVRIDLFATDSWTFRQCTITPVDVPNG